MISSGTTYRLPERWNGPRQRTAPPTFHSTTKVVRPNVNFHTDRPTEQARGIGGPRLHLGRRGEHNHGRRWRRRINEQRMGMWLGSGIGYGSAPRELVSASNGTLPGRVRAELGSAGSGAALPGGLLQEVSTVCNIQINSNNAVLLPHRS